ncbi:MAG: NYN domain-containing protein [Myxococcota bacterium]|jgi:predicted RNA-binding protein with PIN domain|nr:hypothetical protein [Deltaproteobacteria bacterium]MCP4240623.1 NYN domain-containing protein [bacterium]MDP6076037.1 NYN domain-containing protein [Myxococcota bacterium]MDP6242442.1 NYN domain-containing protein [Myxococcota bacterium]MDP7076541.1 NYN domain-containing protein [Myxococcota bacterium]
MRSALGTLGVIAAFVTFGLLWSSGLDARPIASVYPHSMPPEVTPRSMPPAVTPRVWLVDGYNVLCSGLLGGREREGWWQEERRAELLERLRHFDDPAVEIWVVFDGDRSDDTPAQDHVRAVFTPSADAWIVEQVKTREADAPVAVVTADRRVADRARHRGARIVTPRTLLGRCAG